MPDGDRLFVARPRLLWVALGPQQRTQVVQSGRYLRMFRSQVTLPDGQRSFQVIAGLNRLAHLLEQKTQIVQGSSYVWVVTAVYLLKNVQRFLVIMPGTGHVVPLLEPIRFGVPDGVIVSHKHGWNSVTHGDAGIVYSPNGDYILVEYLHQSSNWLPIEYSFPVLREISRTVYNYFNPDEPFEGRPSTFGDELAPPLESTPEGQEEAPGEQEVPEEQEAPEGQEVPEGQEAPEEEEDAPEEQEIGSIEAAASP